jgi:2,4-dienoyl-CoA reductase-like NADH-dependent reductase (Old Yellow Enzyme family)
MPPAADPAVSLFSPLTIGGVEVRNRLMQAAHSKLFSHDGSDTDQDVAYVERRARGGVGLVVSGNRFVHPTAAIRGFQDGWREDTIPAGRRLTEAAHAHGTAIFVQLNHHGAQAQPHGPDGPRAIYSASRTISPSTGLATTACTDDDLAAFVEGWARSAWVAKESGFDGVEVHMAHGYLLQQFLSPLTNHRTDRYGGDTAARARFPLEVLRAVRERVGDDHVVGIRIVADEFHPDGLTNAEVLDIIDLLRAEVCVDFLDLGAGGYHNPHYVFPTAAMPAAWLRDEVAAVKARNPDVAVFGVGAAPDVEVAEEVLRAGVADMVALTRAQIADPDLATKLREGRTDEIRHCIKLNQGCLGRGSLGLPISCTVNPVVGRERTRETPEPTPRQQRVLVVGGGPAGLRAAASFAANGHQVTLLERDQELGGQLRLAATVPGRHTLRQLVDDLAGEVARAGVDVHLGTALRPDHLDTFAPDLLVAATGATAPSGRLLDGEPPLSPGGDGPPIVDAFTALQVPDAVGPRVCIVDDDGTSYAAGVALVLLKRGHQVRLVTRFDTPYPHVAATLDRPLLLERLRAHELEVATDARVSLAASGLVVRHGWTGEVAMLDGVDTVVLSTPRTSVGHGLREDPEVRVVTVGDAVSPRGIDAAIFEAYEAAFTVGRVVP